MSLSRSCRSKLGSSAAMSAGTSSGTRGRDLAMWFSMKLSITSFALVITSIGPRSRTRSCSLSRTMDSCGNSLYSASRVVFPELPKKRLPSSAPMTISRRWLETTISRVTASALAKASASSLKRRTFRSLSSPISNATEGKSARSLLMAWPPLPSRTGNTALLPSGMHLVCSLISATAAPSFTLASARACRVPRIVMVWDTLDRRLAPSPSTICTSSRAVVWPRRSVRRCALFARRNRAT
mmetsp:Transcript_23264/g.67892  ORF Transcript_23264/g.67892 Transcript_23264/m.67892 type:complete len:240 (-) Transcript_23264:271-990(-)